MFSHTTTVRVRYGEVDRMGYAYYGNYALYYEIGRVEAMRALGLDYADMEERGIMMPVVRMECQYHSPALYDQELTVTASVREMPRARIDFHYELRNADGRVINNGMTKLVFVHRDTMRPTRAPQYFLDALLPHFNS
jgi:acyl-CoA thioester hydrolase